ncbi:MAG: HIRAN domain-containing protein [Bacteroidales bacterium]|nr:HIRAN domain-containing protein [Bacteroidales bacterium]
MEKKFLTHFNIAGLTYWDAAEVFTELTIGTELQFEAETDNKYDPEAVAIYFDKSKLGYIPRKMNTTISTLLQCGYTDIFDVRINRLNPTTSPEEQIGVVVRVIKKSGL